MMITTGCISSWIFCCLANTDYSQIAGVPLIFTETDRIQCFGIPILEDATVELDENFSVLFNTSNPAVSLMPCSASVLIRDNDVVTISWNPTSYEVVEGDSAVNVCAQIIGGEIHRQVIVSYSSRDGTAESNQ